MGYGFQDHKACWTHQLIILADVVQWLHINL